MGLFFGVPQNHIRSHVLDAQFDLVSGDNHTHQRRTSLVQSLVYRSWQGPPTFSKRLQTYKSGDLKTSPDPKVFIIQVSYTLAAFCKLLCFRQVLHWSGGPSLSTLKTIDELQNYCLGASNGASWRCQALCQTGRVHTKDWARRSRAYKFRSLEVDDFQRAPKRCLFRFSSPTHCWNELVSN